MRTVFCRKCAACALILFCLAFLCGCGQEQSLKETAVPEGNKLVIYTSHKQNVYAPIVREFENRTGIWVQVETGGSTELFERIRSADGKFCCDVMFGGGIDSYEAAKEDFLPFCVRRKDRLNPLYVSGEDLWTPFTELPIVLIYNSKLVGKEDAPRGFADLMGGNWTGKIAFADPSMSGSSCTILETMLQVLGLPEEETLRRFYEALNGQVSAGSGSAVEEVASGSRLVGLTLEETARQWIGSGADLAIVFPEEGTSALPDGCAIVKGARHRENAELFLNFIVSDDVQQYTQEYLNRRSVLLELADGEQSEGERIAAFDLELAVRRQSRLLREWAEVSDEGIH